MIKRIITLGLLAGLSFSSFAENLYVVGHFGQVYIKDDSSHFSGGLGLGKELTKNIAIELDYRQIGTTKARYSGSGTMVTRTQTRYSSLEASAIFNLPMTNEFNVFGRLGVSSIESKISSSSDVIYTSSKSDFEGLYGVGGAFKLTDAVDVRLEYLGWQDSDFHAIDFGITYSF